VKQQRKDDGIYIEPISTNRIFHNKKGICGIGKGGMTRKPINITGVKI